MLTKKQKGFSTEDPPVVDETADWQTYRNEEDGYEIRYPLDFDVMQNLGETYLLKDNTRIYISVGNDLSVPLNGTFGGRYQYLESQSPNSKVFSEKDNDFTKDYFLAYGGMGNWDTVINANQYKNGNYYIVSLYRGRGLGIPGMADTGGVKLSEEDIISQTLVEMRDKNDSYTKIFDQILSTFKFVD